MSQHIHRQAQPMEVQFTEDLRDFYAQLSQELVPQEAFYNLILGVLERSLQHVDAPNTPQPMMAQLPLPTGQIFAVRTPPELRGRGYASACVAALSQKILDEGKDFCCLFTDLSNSTSNQIYQKMGYRKLGEFAHLSWPAKA